MKKLVSLLLVIIIVATFCSTAFAAGCAGWVYSGASTYCATPTCGNTTTPTQYVNKNYTRWCITDGGNSYQEARNEVAVAGCC